MKTRAQEIVDGIMGHALEIRASLGEQAAADAIMEWLDEEDPLGGQRPFIVQELRRVLDPATRVSEIDYSVEEEVLRRLGGRGHE